LALRPTPDRVREALFDILGDWIIGARVLDLFAGSGAVGIEALSRGAQAVAFVEVHAPACRVITTNLQRCGLHARATVWQADVQQALPAFKRAHETFDLIFLDPPYQAALVEDTLTYLGDGALLAREGQVVAEHFFKRQLQEHYGRLHRVRVTRYGAVALSWYRLAVPQGEDCTAALPGREALPTQALGGAAKKALGQQTGLLLRPCPKRPAPATVRPACWARHIVPEASNVSIAIQMWRCVHFSSLLFCKTMYLSLRFSYLIYYELKYLTRI
jgi:16S rRNA (guanine(966)-N(2))-methyltransferase RsmD